MILDEPEPKTEKEKEKAKEKEKQDSEQKANVEAAEEEKEDAQMDGAPESEDGQSAKLTALESCLAALGNSEALGEKGLRKSLQSQIAKIKSSLQTKIQEHGSPPREQVCLD